MARGTRRADIKDRLTPRRLSWLGWFFGRAMKLGKILAVLAAVVGLCLWIWAQGYLMQVGTWAQGKIAAATASMGVVVGDVIVEGRTNIDTDTLKNAIGVTPGESLFGIDIHAVHARITAISWVKDVQVRRVLPDRLIVTITERLPMALWLDAPNGPAVIDDEGVLLTQQNVTRFGTLLAVEGRGAAKQAGSIIALLKGQPDIAVRVKKAVRVSDRRWDLVLDNNVIIRLPEDDPGYALARASKAQLQEKVLDQDVKAVDLRQTDRIIIENKPGEKRDLLLKNGNPV